MLERRDLLAAAVLRFDVNDDSRVSALDALQIINVLEDRDPPLRLDINRDGKVTAADALEVITFLNSSMSPFSMEVNQEPIPVEDLLDDTIIENSIASTESVRAVADTFVSVPAGRRLDVDFRSRDDSWIVDHDGLSVGTVAETSLVRYVQSPWGDALQFANSRASAVIDSVAARDALSGEDYSLVFSYRPDEGPTSQWRTVLQKGSQAKLRSPGIWIAPNGNRLYIATSTSENFNAGLYSNASISTGQWTHIAVAKRGSQLSVYINGHLDATTKLAGSVLFNGDPIILGATAWASGALASIDQLVVYDRALTEFELRQSVVAPLSHTQVVIGHVGENDSAHDENELTFQAMTTPSQGLLDFRTNGSFVYLSGKNGPAQNSFAYRATDLHGLSDEAVVDLNLNQAPIASGDDFRVTRQKLHFAVDFDSHPDRMILDRDGTPVGTLGNDSSLQFIASSFGTALHLTNPASSVVIDSAAVSTSLSGTESTLVFRYRPDTGPTGQWRSVIHTGSAAAQRSPGVWLRPTSNQIYIAISTQANFNDGLYSRAEVPMGTWTQIAIVRHGRSVWLYLNGRLDNMAILQAEPLPSVGPVRLGATPWSIGAGGAFDEFLIFDSVLPEVQLRQSQASTLTARQVVQGSVATNDIDPETHALKFTLLSPPAGGSVDFLSNGSFVYLADLDALGIDTFSYITRDSYDQTDRGLTRINRLNEASVVSLKAELQGHWPFDDREGSQVVDRQDGQTNGIIAGSPEWITDGVVGTALRLDGVDSFVTIPSSSRFNVYAGNFSFGIWVQTTQPNSVIVSRGNLVTDYWALRIVNGKPRFEFDPGGSPIQTNGASVISDGQWHHLLAVRHGTHSARLFVDGVFQDQFETDGPYRSIDTFADVVIGGPVRQRFNGVIDEGRYYRRALTQADARTLYELGSQPVAILDVYAAEAGQTLNINASQGLLANDESRGTLPIVATLRSLPSLGTVSLQLDGSFTYTPRDTSLGVDSFTYSITDAEGVSRHGQVQIHLFRNAEWETLAVRMTQSANDSIVTATAAEISEWLSRQQTSGGFNDIDYNETLVTYGSALMSHTYRTSAMAKAIQNPQETLYQNASVLEGLELAFRFLANELPGSQGIANWYLQQIGVPNSLWPGMVLMQGKLPPTVQERLIEKYFDDANAWDSDDLSERNGGMNLTYRARTAVARSILTRETWMIPRIVSLVSNDINYRGRQATGLRPDNSFHQHTSYPVGETYAGGVQPGKTIQWAAGSYGVGYADQLADLVSWFHDTSFAFSKLDEVAVVDFLLEGQAFLFRGSSIEPTSQGRSITLNSETTPSEEVIEPASYMARAATKLLVLDDRRDQLQEFVDRLTSDSALPLVGNRAYWTSDVMIHHRPEFMAAVRMISQRSLRPETLLRPDQSRSEGTKSYFLADGVTTLFVDGDEYGDPMSDEIFPLWNWTRLPGTTLEQLDDADLRALTNSTARNPFANVGSGTFVGSVSDGALGMAAMQYRRPQATVSAKKSWFFFDGGFIALGSDISAPRAEQRVNTTLAQVLADDRVVVGMSDESEVRFFDERTLSSNEAKWILHDGIGYVPIGDNDTLHVSKETRHGNWSDIGISDGQVSAQVFTAWFDHGERPDSATYAYAVLPGSDESKLNSFTSQADWRVLANSETIAAVHYDLSSTTQIVFYEPGELTIRPGLTIKADQACLLIIQESSDNQLHITLADPSQTLDSVRLNISLRLSGAEGVSHAPSGASSILINLPSGENDIYRGESLSMNFAIGS